MREPKEPGWFTKFRLLMWKNFLQQWRHGKQTIVEMMLPVLTLSLVLILRSQIEPTMVSTVTYPAIRAHSLNFSAPVLLGMNIRDLSIAYSPTSPLLDNVVRSAVYNLLLQNAADLLPRIIDVYPELEEIELPPDLNINSTVIQEFLKSLIKVDGYDNSTQLRGLYAIEDTTRKVIAAVEFDDSLYGTTELPLNLEYSLRFPERPRLNSFFSQGSRSWRTSMVIPIFEITGPRFRSSWEGGNDPGYVNEMFIALQHVISRELVSRLTETDLRSFDVNINRYPHPPYVSDLAVEALQYLFPVFLVLSFSYTAINITRAVTYEKEMQLKETMKIMGLPTWLHWTAWFCKQFIYLCITSIFIVVLLKVNWFTNEDGFSEYAVFTNTPWTVLLFFILLYLTCTIFFCFMVSGMFSKASTAALFMGILWFVTYIPAFLMTLEVDMSYTVQGFTCLLINSAMSYGIQLLMARESTGGLQWGEFMDSPSADSTRFVFGNVVVMLAVDCVLYMLIALYLEQVLPGPYGTPKSWYFLFQKDFWCPNRTAAQGFVLGTLGEQNDIIKENDPIGHTAGVKMTNLTKIYGSNIAVNDLTLNIYDDQITVLLGHNGAGKSTTISMLTGNVPISHGSIIVAGYNMSTQASIARSYLGLCPQHNVLFNELTVKEHLEFFARLKGFTGKDLIDDIEALIEKLELTEKRDYESNGLSGGQKRRLCVGIALSGGAKVVLLDEPTSGMDPASRRALWDLLQKEKKGRSMILTTHFMDEADILGDRVAIMSQGRLQCVGSPYFLKRHYGVGYTLVVVKDEGFNTKEFTDVIHRHIPGISVKEDRGSEVTYDLANDKSHLFEDLLNDFEKNIATLRFKNYGLTATTIEDVFMSVGADLANVSSDSDDGAISIDEAIESAFKYDLEASSVETLDKDEDTVTGWRLLCQHVWAVWMKLWFVWTRSWVLIILQLSVPIIVMNASLGIIQYMMTFIDVIQSRQLTLAQGFTQTESLISFMGNSTESLGASATLAYQDIIQSAGLATMEVTRIDRSLDEYYLQRGENPVDMGTIRHRILTGATFEDNSATAWFSNFGYHDVAISLTTVHGALLKALNSSASLTVYNHPLESSYSNQNDLEVMYTMLSMQLSNAVGSTMSIVTAVFVMFYIKERISGAKLAQKAAGVQPIVLWGSAAVFDWLWFSIICISILISCAIFNVVGLSTATQLGRLYLCILVFGTAMLPLNYLMSNLFNGPAVGFVVVFFLNTLFGMIGAQIVQALASPQLDTEEAATILDAILQFYPGYSMVTCVRTLNQIGLTEHSCMEMCEYLSAVMPNITECTMQVMCELYSSNCCVRENPYFDWEEPGVLRYLVALLISSGVLWALLMIVEYKVINKIYTFKKAPPPLDESTLDVDVAQEAKLAQGIEGARLGDQALVAKGLSKYYGKNLAVDQLSFTVNDAECFGLLGVNGAGKTTTFKMMMGDETISSGEACVSGYSVQKQLTRVHNNIGYCPQFDALFGELTGRETLRLFSLLRGLRAQSIDSRSLVLANALGFLKHIDKKVDQYSGGTKRKLNTAISFLGRTRLVFVDEPTTGVDPAAKRHVWRAMRGVQRAGRGLVLTSHSMEECEAMCSRLTIMVNGRFQCLGTPQHLKNKFSQGFTLTIKIKLDDRNINCIEAVKRFVETNFLSPKIMEEYQGLITYYLPDRTVPWSRMFGVMERAKRDLDVEDYSISQTTLEQIFLQFTKYQREGL